MIPNMHLTLPYLGQTFLVLSYMACAEDEKKMLFAL